MNARSAIKPAVLRCAVYTRKSSEEGLEQAFNSLHAQRQSCSAYILSQAGEGWSEIAAAYDDGGISGGTMERPGLKALLADVEARRIDVVVVYKVDRLTRSLTDFARIVERFDAHGVSFVSVTQAFNTTSSMGRLTLNVLLSFAQFEREVTGERIRDKIALSKAKGLWMGGNLPLGYDSHDRRLVPNAVEAEVVRMIFARYLKLKSVHRLCEALNAEGVRSKAWVTSKGRTVGGMAFSRGALFHLLQNRHYLGEIVHKGQVNPGLHPAIVDRHTFEAVQKQLLKNRTLRRRRGQAKAATALLTGKLYDERGERFSPSFSTGRGGRIHRYYVAADLQQGRASAAQHAGRRPDAIRRVGAEALERLVLSELRRLGERPHASADELLSLLHRLELRPSQTHLVLDQDRLFGDDHPELALEDLRARLSPGERLVQEPPRLLRIVLPRRMQLRGGRTWAFSGEGESERRSRPDPALIAALQRAHRLASADQAPVSPYERKLVALAYLAPDLQRMIVQGRQPPEMTLARLLRAETPLSWAEQLS